MYCLDHSDLHCFHCTKLEMLVVNEEEAHAYELMFFDTSGEHEEGSGHMSKRGEASRRWHN